MTEKAFFGCGEAEIIEIDHVRKIIVYCIWNTVGCYFDGQGRINPKFRLHRLGDGGDHLLPIR